MIYHENVTFFHAKLRSDVWKGIHNQTFGDTLQILMETVVIRQ